MLRNSVEHQACRKKVGIVIHGFNCCLLMGKQFDKRLLCALTVWLRARVQLASQPEGGRYREGKGGLPGNKSSQI